MRAKHFLNQLEQDRVVAAIGEAEKKTSGEIRVFISRWEPTDALAAARTQFSRLAMHQTRERNGVLIFVAPRVSKFAVIGDEGVHAKCGDAFWTDVAKAMSGYFKRQQFTEGLLHGIEKAGELLAQHFPRHADDKNQLSNEIESD